MTRWQMMFNIILHFNQRCHSEPVED